VTTIHLLTERINAPLNIMAMSGAPTVAELAKLGVRRISVGMAIAQASLTLTRNCTNELLKKGTYTSLQDGFDYHQMNQLLTRN
jgi:2-methylisocitrate lyase-like PEP mutase family enzyme